MKPILLQIGPLYLHTYGVMLVLGFVVGIYLATHESDRLGLDTDAVLDLCYWILVSSILGARIFHVLVYRESYFVGPHPTLKLWQAGPVFYVSLAAAIAYLLGSRLFFRRLDQDPRTTDHLVPAALAVGLGMVNAIAYSRAARAFVTAEGQRSSSYASPTAAFAVTAGILVGAVLLLALKWRRTRGWMGWSTIATVGLAVAIAWANQIAFHYEDYRRDALLDIFRIWKGGLTFYGGFLAAVVVSIVFCRLRGLSFLRVADATSPSIILGLAFGRLGCFSAGCCYGAETSLPWGIEFTARSTLARPLGMPLHPTQIYESLASAGIFLALTALKGRVRFPGGIFWLSLLLYAPARFAIEFVRADPRGHMFGMSESQIVGIALVTLAAGGMAWHYLAGGRRGGASEAAP